MNTIDKIDKKITKALEIVTKVLSVIGSVSCFALAIKHLNSSFMATLIFLGLGFTMLLLTKQKYA